MFLIVFICISFFLCQNDEPIDMEIKKNSPRIVAAGKLSSLDPVYLVEEGTIVCLVIPSMATSLSLLVACCYVFNMEYPLSSIHIFMFLERIVKPKNSHGQHIFKRIGVIISGYEFLKK